MHEFHELLDTASLAMARSEGFVPEDLHASLRANVASLRRRSGFFGDVMLVALAGGTGSGKSSLVNAIVGGDVVRTGVVRPTTDYATAIVPSHLREAVAPHIARLGIDVQMSVERDSAIVLIDLPDFDSIEEAHRHIVVEVLPVVDAVVWVFDPEKYADPDIHRTFLATLAPYSDQFVFALNKADTIGSTDVVDAMVRDLRRLLSADGLTDVEVVASSARAHDVWGVDDVVRSMDRRLDVKRTAYLKATTDFRVLADRGYRACLEDRESNGDSDARALAAATFVSLGVQAYAVHHSMKHQD